jgi:ribokinase
MPNSSAPCIVVIGSLNVDLTTTVDQLPRAGETIFGREFHLGFGGKGGNQAAAARLCGARVSMVARVGEDLFGPATIDNLASFGIDAAHVVITLGASTGVAPIFIDGSGQNRILVVKGANDDLSPADVDAASECIKSADVLLLQFEVPLETVYHTLGVAHRLRIRTILNPAPAQAVDVDRLKTADYLIPNESEAESLTGIEIRSADDARQCATRLLEQGFRQIVITLGEKGAIYACGSCIDHIPAFDARAVDTSGAGDAFIGSFAFCVASGLPDIEAVRRANLYAALSTLKPGTRTAFPNHDEWSAEWATRLR